MRGLFPAAAVRTPPCSTRRRSQHDLHAVPRDFHCAPRQFGTLGGVLVEYRVGVVHVNENLASGARQPFEPLEHAAWAALRQMTDVAGAFVRDAEADHLVIGPE